jgi:hypothetical protein
MSHRYFSSCRYLVISLTGAAFGAYASESKLFEKLKNGVFLVRKNVGSIDRVIRFTLGLVLVAYALQLGFPSTGWNWVGWIGVVPLFTAVFSTCPAYTILGVSTCSRG